MKNKENNDQFTTAEIKALHHDQRVIYTRAWRLALNSGYTRSQARTHATATVRA